jgi:hypothetical protein
MTKFLTAVSALALGLAMSSAALADDVTNNDNSDVAQVNDNGDNRDNDQSQTNGNAVLSNNDNNGNDSSNNSNQDNGNQDNDLNGSFNGNDASDDDTLTVSGNNLNSNNGGNDSSNNSNQDNGNNRENDQSTNVAVVGNSLLSGNTTNSNNDNRVDNSVSIEDTAIGIQSLDANVSDVGVTQGAVGLLALAGNDQNTGDITASGNAFSQVTGIATVSQNSGLGSAGQAATAINANASLNFD